MDEITPIALTTMRQSMRDESIQVDLVLIAGGGAESYRQAAERIFPHSPILSCRRVPYSPMSGVFGTTGVDMRVVVNIPAGSYRELFEAFEQIPFQERAERMLATVGLLFAWSPIPADVLPVVALLSTWAISRV